MNWVDPQSSWTDHLCSPSSFGYSDQSFQLEEKIFAIRLQVRSSWLISSRFGDKAEKEKDSAFQNIGIPSLRIWFLSISLAHKEVNSIEIWLKFYRTLLQINFFLTSTKSVLSMTWIKFYGDSLQETNNNQLVTKYFRAFYKCWHLASSSLNATGAGSEEGPRLFSQATSSRTKWYLVWSVRYPMPWHRTILRRCPRTSAREPSLNGT